MLMSYSWPGNIRELRNVLERAVIIAREGAALRCIISRRAFIFRGKLHATLLPAAPAASLRLPHF